MSKNSDQNTPLHVPAQMNMVRFLTVEMHCDHTLLLKVELLTMTQLYIYQQ